MKRIWQNIFFSGVLFLAVVSFQAIGEAQREVELFVTSWCPYCQKLESILKLHNVQYKRYDIESDAEGMKKFSAIGGRGIPVTRVDDKIFPGFDPQGILDAIRE